MHGHGVILSEPCAVDTRLECCFEAGPQAKPNRVPILYGIRTLIPLNDNQRCATHTTKFASMASTFGAALWATRKVHRLHGLRNFRPGQ